MGTIKAPGSLASDSHVRSEVMYSLLLAFDSDIKKLASQKNIGKNKEKGNTLKNQWDAADKINMS